MNQRYLSVWVAWSLCCTVAPAGAETVACPDLSQMRQVGACPSEEELQYTFTGYCSDDNKAYRGETDVCTNYQAYRAMKNVALWESVDGRFDAYVSCAKNQARLSPPTAISMRAVTLGKLTRLVCAYGDGLAFTHRTRAQCSVGVASCGTTAADCKAVCE